jgi:hypothetical protein
MSTRMASPQIALGQDLVEIGGESVEVIARADDAVAGSQKRMKLRLRGARC